MAGWIACNLLLDRDVMVSGPSWRELIRAPHRFQPCAALAKQVTNSHLAYP